MEFEHSKRRRVIPENVHRNRRGYVRTWLAGCSMRPPLQTAASQLRREQNRRIGWIGHIRTLGKGETTTAELSAKGHDTPLYLRLEFLTLCSDRHQISSA